MRARTLSMVALVGFVMSGLGGIVSAEDGYPIAGTRPSERPLGAPVITEVKKGPSWYQQALTGVSKPYPLSLRFLEDQGNWYTPFNHPGMHGPYDIRGWYRQ